VNSCRFCIGHRPQLEAFLGIFSASGRVCWARLWGAGVDAGISLRGGRGRGKNNGPHPWWGDSGRGAVMRSKRLFSVAPKLHLP